MPPGAPAEPTTLPGIDVPEATNRTLLAILGLGVAFDLTLNGQQPGVSIPLFALLLATALRRVGRRSAETGVILAGASVLSIFPALRASVSLTALDVLAASALFG
ncbi:MAG: hypothetical protein ACRDKS_07160, partial [Actinomycetota bacterium]